MNTARFATLQQWLGWQQSLHPRAIDLGLERLEHVMRALKMGPPRYTVITVGGTNGKGSCVAYLEAILRAQGYRVGTYTSPHLMRYNERIRVDGIDVEDANLCRAFARIDAARGDISLTYFEFGTLAAFAIFAEADINVAVLEVGLGGRLDAVNVLDADAAVVTTVDIDHVEWLGPDRNSIGYEKAGIYRPGRPAICADPEPPESLLNYAKAIAAKLYLVGKDYGFEIAAQGWNWWHNTHRLEALPLPAMFGDHQRANAAAALMVLTTLSERLPVSTESIRRGFASAYLPARFQVIDGPVEWILDVTHNPQGVSILAACLKTRLCRGRTYAVLGMLSDKDAVAVARILDDIVDYWYAATLVGSRGRSGQQLAATLQDAGVGGKVSYFDSVADACRTAKQKSAECHSVIIG